MVNLPNLLTLLRLVLVAPVLVLVHGNHTAAALVVYLMLLSTDMLDGYAARKLKQDTPFGEYFDFMVDFVCYYALIGYFINTGRVEPFNIALIIVATVALAWIAVTLSVKAKRLYMPHRTSSKVLAVLLTISIVGFLIGSRFENLLFLIVLSIIYVYTLPDYIRYTLRYKAA